MARVRATCPDCGDIEVGSADVRARVCVDDNSSSYAFRCPRCDLATAKQAGERIIQLLVGAGTPLAMWRLPAELSEVHDGPALTSAHLDELHRLLDTADWFSQLSSMVRS